MIYNSTRSNTSVDSLEAVLAGLAPDGGLYVSPDMSRIDFDWRTCLTKQPLQMMQMILEELLPDYGDLSEEVELAYKDKFSAPELTPLVKVGEDYVLELFHGPSCAFKDVALSVLPRLISSARRKLGEKCDTLILTATSGDTGKAALEGFHDVPGTRIIVFYPDGGVSPIQRAQMVTQNGANVRVCAVRGNFDDCQRGVKEAFLKLGECGTAEKHGLKLSSANSINIGRLAPQLCYYFIAYSKLLSSGRIRFGDTVDFSVPTGNFGDILAGYYAKQLGLPVGKLICASNENRVLTDFIQSGIYDRRREFVRTSSPSMDILVSSNLERLLYHIMEGGCEELKDCMEKLSRQGWYQIGSAAHRKIRDLFSAYCCDEQLTAECIQQVWSEHNYLIDPHTAVAWHGAQEYKKRRSKASPLVVLSTASPYKFPAAVLSAIGEKCAEDEFEQLQQLETVSGIKIPDCLASLRNKEELHGDVIDRDELISYIIKYMEE